MDPPEPSGGGGSGSGSGKETSGGVGGRVPRVVFLRNLILHLAAPFLFSFLAGLVGLAIEQLSVSSLASLPSSCRIVSSGVDVRTSKICELGILNYRAKRVLYPSEKNTRFPCHYDYYWSAIFEVEYKEYFTSQIFHAVAEVPKEALPEKCRPGFEAAWLTKMKFKVNETYSCRYIPGSKKADIMPDDLFHCQAKEPAITEMFRRFFILRLMLINILNRSKNLCLKEFSGRHILHSAAGVIFGMLVSLFVLVLVRIFQNIARTIVRNWTSPNANIMVKLRRFCLLVAYICAMCWLSLHYSKLIGSQQLFSKRSV
ncbi:uncharacterized protein LOC122016513 isoform X1 [Zingiber officinale]|uniref:uncharacterized protein LOC122016513 isoform X1 n=1 Tax=Zingiber officinale TaxID=94328 RepID=UPI001C4DC9E5|nr:uncharacterized protein LOC122016513 isoform X1 [Zingiber officinale]